MLDPIEERTNMKKTTIQSTLYGPVVIIWIATASHAKVVRVLLSSPVALATKTVATLYPDSHEFSCRQIDSLSQAICRFLEGEAVAFSIDVADLGVCGEFQRRVLVAEHEIPRGRVSTYKLIAAHLGTPNAARAVGNALARNPFPLIVPCHRAIRSDYNLGGYQGGVVMKQSLLIKEGIAFDESRRVICSPFYYG
jgi:methylated-DNA-[protein]-cysteine S-methyltransferase